MLEGCGFEVINLGVDISDRQFVEAVKKYNPQIVCLSALLTTTMNYMQNVIDTLAAEGLRDKVKVLVGGAPVNEEFAMWIGADGYSSNAMVRYFWLKEFYRHVRRKTDKVATV